MTRTDLSSLTPTMRTALLDLAKQARAGERDDLDGSRIAKSTLLALQSRGFITLRNITSWTERSRRGTARSFSSYNIAWTR